MTKEEQIDWLCRLRADLNNGVIFTPWNKEFTEALNDILEQELRWIPVSERLPKIAGVYRVTRYYPNNVMNPNYLVDACCFDGYNTWYNDNRINHERNHVINIIAWQENPEPYKVESSLKHRCHY